MVYANGDIYRGNWVKGYKLGDEEETGFKQGKGMESYIDGSYYKGDYYEGKKHGKGVFNWPDQSKYEGD